MNYQIKSSERGLDSRESPVSATKNNDGSLMVIEYGVLSGMMTGSLIKWSKDREIK